MGWYGCEKKNLRKSIKIRTQNFRKHFFKKFATELGYLEQKMYQVFWTVCPKMNEMYELSSVKGIKGESLKEEAYVFQFSTLFINTNSRVTVWTLNPAKLVNYSHKWMENFLSLYTVLKHSTFQLFQFKFKFTSPK